MARPPSTWRPRQPAFGAKTSKAIYDPRVIELTSRLEAQFNTTFLPVEVARENFFAHLSKDVFNRRARSNGFGFPIITGDRSQKAAMFVHIEDLAVYLNWRRALSVYEQGSTSVSSRVMQDRVFEALLKDRAEGEP